MTATVVKTNGKAKFVKDLGWLLRHRRDGIAKVKIIAGEGDATYYQVTFENGTIYRTVFASFAVCWAWTRSHLLKNGWVARKNVSIQLG